MYQKVAWVIVFSLSSIAAMSQAKKESGYEYTVDLTQVVDDKVYIELTPPPTKQREVTFYFPKIIPGTYSIADYGRFISDFKAVDKKGKPLPVEKTEVNAWKIKEADKVAKISYWVEDSFDTKLSGPEVFWPAGTNIEADKNYVINASGFFGYMDGLKKLPYNLTVIRQQDFYGSTGLIPAKSGEPVSKLQAEKGASTSTKRADRYVAGDYDQLVDSPIMYAKVDTAVIKVGNTEVLIGSYSPNKMINSKQIAASVKEVLQAQKEYLGGNLPVEKYAFIFYFTDQPVYSYGALEHSYSSFYYMPEATIEEMNQQLRDFAAHEFFHIVTPLTIHSEEIEHFDFNNPKMSQHLWLYEGVTEYFAGNCQVKYGLISPDEYLEVLREKMFTADQFQDDLPFTELSKKTLDEHKEQYYNVYMKGALIGLCMDIKLRKLSNGNYGMQNLVADLSKKYGKNKAFQDDQLFDEITKMTYPEIGVFLKNHVGGPEKLPLQQVFNDVGITYSPEEIKKEISLGLENQAIAIVSVDNKPMLAIGNTEALNDQGKALQFQTNDILIKINGEPIPDLGPEIGPYIEKQQASLKEGGTLSYTVLRKNEQSENQEVELKAEIKKVNRTKKHILEFNPDATPGQLALRKSWLTPQ
jgi:predicted metalloprotease with PDZ domain